MPSMNKDQNDELVIVIPIFNRFDEIKNLLNQLKIQSYKNFKVLIVDHGTQDFILSPSPDTFFVQIVKASSNLWFTGAINRGLEYVYQYYQNEIKYILLMNDDIIIEDINFLQRLLDEGSEKKIVSCMAVTKENKIIYSGIQFDKLKLKYKRIGQGKRLDQLSEEISPKKIICDVLPTRCTLVPVKIFKKIGFLNENKLPHYGSDYEWTSRAKRHGFQLVMLNYIYVKTEINNKEVSGRKKYKKPAIVNFTKEFFNKYSRNNIYQIINYSLLVFGFPYNLLFAFYLISRKVAGFLINNIIPLPFQTKSLSK